MFQSVDMVPTDVDLWLPVLGLHGYFSTLFLVVWVFFLGLGLKQCIELACTKKKMCSTGLIIMMIRPTTSNAGAK